MSDSEVRSDLRDEAQRPQGGGRGGRIALAVAPDHLVVARLRRERGTLRIADVRQCALPPLGRDGWPELEEALRELASDLDVPGGGVDVALLRRLAHTKVIPLPPVRPAELPALVQRSARRHFAVRDEPLVADGSRLPGAASASLVPTIAACAPTQVVEAVAAACAAAGFRVGRIVPGPVALAEAVCARLHRARHGRVAALTAGAAGADLVLLDDGIPVRVQPLGTHGGADAAVDRLRAALAESEQDARYVEAIVVCGSGDEARALREALHVDHTYGPRLVFAAEVEQVPAEATVALGAALARPSAPLLLPPALLAARARRAARRTVAMAAASAVLLAGAAGLHLWGLRRELNAVQARRGEIASSVAKAREMSGSVEGVRARLESIASLERDAAAWTEEIAALAAALPDSAHLRTLAVDSTGLRLAGLARSASAVVPALEAHPRFSRVSLAAPVRFEQGDAGERFDVVAQLQGGGGQE
jgi:Tfp pilus assembly protein PilN